MKAQVILDMLEGQSVEGTIKLVTSARGRELVFIDDEGDSYAFSDRDLDQWYDDRGPLAKLKDGDRVTIDKKGKKVSFKKKLR